MLTPTARRVLLVLGSWVGVRRHFRITLLLTAPRMVLPQDPSTNAPVALAEGAMHISNVMMVDPDTDRPVQSKIRVPLCAARTLNVTGQCRVTLSLQ